MKIRSPFRKSSWRCRLSVVGSTLESLWKYSRAMQNTEKWYIEQSRVEEGLFEENALLTLSSIWLESKRNCISLVVLVPIWQSQAQSCTQQVTVSIRCRDLCAWQVGIDLDTSMEVLRAASKAGRRWSAWCFSPHWGADMGKRFLFNFDILLCSPCSLNFFSVLFLVCDLLASLTCLPKPPRGVACSLNS